MTSIHARSCRSLPETAETNLLVLILASVLRSFLNVNSSVIAIVIMMTMVIIIKLDIYIIHHYDKLK